MKLELRRVPSATKIWLATINPYESGECSWDALKEAESVELLTIKEPTSIEEPIAIADLRTLQPGDIIKPGLKLIRHDIPAGIGINCLFIEVSPLAP